MKHSRRGGGTDRGIEAVNDALKAENNRRAATEKALTKAMKPPKRQICQDPLLAAASHDLLQPLNAARLFTTSLAERSNNEEVRELTNHLEGIKLCRKPHIYTTRDFEIGRRCATGRTAPFRLSELFGQLSQEFQLLAEQRNIRFKAKSRDVIVDTDPNYCVAAAEFPLQLTRYAGHNDRVLFAVRTFGGMLESRFGIRGLNTPDDLPSA